ncbi:MAG: hypothetical protein ACRDBM_14285 [Sporomusa sp.]
MKAFFKEKKVKYGGKTYPANTKFDISENDAEHLKGLGATIIEIKKVGKKTKSSNTETEADKENDSAEIDVE